MTDLILDDPADATAAWFTEVLRADGVHADVVGFTASPIGTGQMAHNERFVLEYGPGSPGPASLVGKFPSPDPTSRAAGARGAYAAEVNFYRDIAGTVAIRTPRSFFAAATDDSTRFTLLLEDMAPATQGDQIAGCDLDTAGRAVSGLAGLHGPRWDDPTLAEHEWLRSSRDDPDVLAFTTAYVRDATVGFIERYRPRLAPHEVEVCEGFAAGIDRWLVEPPVGTSLVHGDYRLDNLLIGSDGDDTMCAVDWQTVRCGPPLNDLAYFCGNSLTVEDRRRHEADLLATYREALASHGVTLSASDTEHSYRMGTFHGPLITILGAMSVIETERGDDMFMAMISRSSQQIIDLDALDLLQ